jgi:UDP-3-O-[3-hydroxymyristoyl] glucosamine N-acyltransferase
MKTSELIDIVSSLDIITEGVFCSLGYLNQSKTNMLSYLDDSKFLQDFVLNHNISCLISKKELIPLLTLDRAIGLVVSDNPKRDFFLIHNYLSQKTDFYFKKFDSKIGSNTIIHQTAYVAASNVKLGKNCEIGPHVSILEGTIIGDNVIISAGSCIGNEGFEFKRFGDEILHVSHAGGVDISDRVEIQANCCIAKGVFGDNTEIGESTKLASLINVAHGAKIGKRCMIASSVMIAGSAIIGDNVWIGPSTSIASKNIIGNNSFLGIASVITQNVPEGSHFVGSRVTRMTESNIRVESNHAEKISINIEGELLRIASEVFPNEECISINSNKNNTYGWDSLGNMNLLMALEDEFGIEFNEDELMGMQSLKDILNVICSISTNANNK